jgi:hypothetical protein
LIIQASTTNEPCTKVSSHGLPSIICGSYNGMDPSQWLGRLLAIIGRAPRPTGSMLAVTVDFPSLFGDFCKKTLTLIVSLEHLHPATERHALEMRFEGLQACTKVF